MRKFLDLLLVSIVALTAYQLYYVWVVWKGFGYLEIVAYSRESRPFVYRVLIPWLSRLLEQLTGVHAVYCMILLVILSAIGLFYSLKYFYTAFKKDDEHAGLFAFAGCELSILLVLLGVKVYDIASVMFFAFSLGLLARDKFNLYYLVFVIASINRETTFLLTLFYAVYFFGRIPQRPYFLGLLFQGAAYFAIKLAIMAGYASAPGTFAQWRPVEVLEGYIDVPVWFAPVFLVFFCGLVGAAIYHWERKPGFLCVAFLALFPALLILHLFWGYAYEIRVFAELFPVLFLMAVWHAWFVQDNPEENRRNWSAYSTSQMEKS